MKPEIKAEWLKRLESGNYKHCKCALCNEHNQHCCLGVLAEYLVEQGDMRKSSVINEISAYTFTDILSNRSSDVSLPPRVRDKIGLTHAQMIELQRLNDATSTTSYDPAIDYIKENL